MRPTQGLVSLVSKGRDGAWAICWEGVQGICRSKDREVECLPTEVRKAGEQWSKAR